MNINNLFNKVNNIINTKKEENRLYNELLNKSLKFDSLQNIVTYNNILNEGKWEEILELCPNLNIDKAKLINSLIPINETYLKIIYTTQKIDNHNYIIILTNKYIWILDKEKYLVINYQDVTIFDIISKSLMSQIVNFNHIILEIDTTQNNLNEIYNLIKDENYKNIIIKEKTKYLCGITPTYQKLNKINSGISIDNNQTIIFHNKKINNYACKYQNIKNYEVLEDNIVVLKKKTDEYSHNLTSVKQTCINIIMRITLNDGTQFNITILEPTTFNSNYNHQDTIYIKNINFAKEIVNKLDSLAPKLY